MQTNLASEVSEHGSSRWFGFFLWECAAASPALPSVSLGSVWDQIGVTTDAIRCGLFHTIQQHVCQVFRGFVQVGQSISKYIVPYHYE